MTKIVTVDGVRIDTSATGLAKIVNGDVISEAAKKFILDIGPTNMTFAGSGMTYDAGDCISGQITRIASDQGLVMNDLRLAAPLLFDTLQAHDTAGLAALLFSGKDKMTGADLADVLYGYAGKDLLVGGGAADRIDGGDGQDRINGGIGRDSLTGGAGADAFIYTSLADSSATDDHLMDMILDLTNVDFIDVSAIDADTTQDGDQAFQLVGAVFTHHAGEAIVRYSSGYNSGGFLFDVNGDGAADMTIGFSGDHRDFTNLVL